MNQTEGGYQAFPRSLPLYPRKPFALFAPIPLYNTRTGLHSMPINRRFVPVQRTACLLHRTAPSFGPGGLPILYPTAVVIISSLVNTNMHHFTKMTLLILALLMTGLVSCKPDLTPNPTAEPPDTPSGEAPVDPPFTTVPEEFVGTWFASHNEGPLTTSWEKGLFQGEPGFREFRTMIFTPTGRDAIEYTTEVVNLPNETRQICYRITGTLVYQNSPASLTFHAQIGIRRVFSTAYSGYRDTPIQPSDMQKYRVIWENPQATSMSFARNFLTATIIDKSGRYSVTYEKAGSGSSTPIAGLPSPKPITGGSSVKIGDLYYPTVVIGRQEWLATNYAGPSRLNESAKPQYGTFLELADLKRIPLPAGWRVPSRQDYMELLQSQGLTVYEWGTDGDDVPSKRLLGQLMATTGWTKQDGYATNQSGFTAIPADVRRLNGTNYGEGSNCTLWTSDRDSQDNPLVFNIIQLPGSTYARFSPQPLGTVPTLTPARLVRDR